MEELALTPARLARIWWSFVWRFLVLSIAGGIAAGIILAIGALMLGLNPEAVGRSGMAQLLFALMACASVYLVLRWVLVLRWPEFRIALVRRQD